MMSLNEKTRQKKTFPHKSVGIIGALGDLHVTLAQSIRDIYCRTQPVWNDTVYLCLMLPVALNFSIITVTKHTLS